MEERRMLLSDLNCVSPCCSDYREMKENAEAESFLASTNIFRCYQLTFAILHAFTDGSLSDYFGQWIFKKNILLCIQYKLTLVLAFPLNIHILQLEGATICTWLLLSLTSHQSDSRLLPVSLYEQHAEKAYYVQRSNTSPTA